MVSILKYRGFMPPSFPRNQTTRSRKWSVTKNRTLR